VTALMNGFLNYIERLNAVTALLAIFAGHLLLYLMLGEDDWLFATVSATLTYALVLYLLKYSIRKRNRGTR